MTEEQMLKAFLSEDIRYVAHRFGYKTSRLPENSFAALKAIFADEEFLGSIDSFEFDINITKDGHLVVVHDVNLAKLSNCDKNVYDLTLEEFKKVEFSYRVGDENKTNEVFYAPTLIEVLDYFNQRVELLEGKTIRVESKGDEYLSMDLIPAFIEVLKDYPNLHKHIQHITFMDEFINQFDQLKKKYDIKIPNEKLFWYDWVDELVPQNELFELVGMEHNNRHLTNEYVRNWNHVCFYTVNGKKEILELLEIVEPAAFKGKKIYLTTDDYREIEKLKKIYCN